MGVRRAPPLGEAVASVGGEVAPHHGGARVIALVADRDGLPVVSRTASRRGGRLAMLFAGGSMSEHERTGDQADAGSVDARPEAHVIEPDSELGRAMTRARERWMAADPAETIGVDEEALHKAVEE